MLKNVAQTAQFSATGGRSGIYPISYFTSTSAGSQFLSASGQWLDNPQVSMKIPCIKLPMCHSLQNLFDSGICRQQPYKPNKLACLCYYSWTDVSLSVVDSESRWLTEVVWLLQAVLFGASAQSSNQTAVLLTLSQPKYDAAAQVGMPLENALSGKHLAVSLHCILAYKVLLQQHCRDSWERVTHLWIN